MQKVQTYGKENAMNSIEAIAMGMVFVVGFGMAVLIITDWSVNRD